MRQKSSCKYQFSLKPVILGSLALLAAGCATLSWYGQAVHGQLDLLSRREHIAELIASPETSSELRERLLTVLEVRTFASEQLGLPDSRSYGMYADLERDAAVWNVIATPRFSVRPISWCYPIVGCLGFRGYFSLDRARTQADRLREDGYDVAVMPAVAYSTLGWFADPVLNTMLAWDDARLAGFIFHELTHEKLFVPGELAFNEAYATVVEREGVRRWLQVQGRDQELAAWEADQRLFQARTEVLLDTRRQLASLYEQALDEEEMATAKKQLFEQLSQALAELAERMQTDRLDGWINATLNNAHLAMVATYEDGTAAFERLLADCDQDLACFHAEVGRLAGMDSTVRQEFLLLK